MHDHDQLVVLHDLYRVIKKRCVCVLSHEHFELWNNDYYMHVYVCVLSYRLMRISLYMYSIIFI